MLLLPVLYSSWKSLCLSSSTVLQVILGVCHFCNPCLNCLLKVWFFFPYPEVPVLGANMSKHAVRQYRELKAKDRKLTEAEHKG